MFATNQYLDSALKMFQMEGSLVKSTRVLVDSNYDIAMRAIPLFNHPKSLSVRMLASWELPVTLASMYFSPLNAIIEAKETLTLLMEGKYLPTKFDGMISKAIQALRLHHNLNYREFIVISNKLNCLKCPATATMGNYCWAHAPQLSQNKRIIG